jgi:dihydrofolate reductase
MSKVFVDMGISLDGFVAGLNGGPQNPLGDNGTEIHKWVFSLKSFREHLGQEGGENNIDNELVEKTFNRIGANIMGKRMFIEGEVNWPENAPFHTPVYVLTHESRKPWERKGGTTFYFTKEDIKGVLQKAKQESGNKDVRISGGADVVAQYFNAGLVDEFTLHISPVILGSGVSLFDKIKKEKFSLEIAAVNSSPNVTHIKYTVVNHKNS